MTASSSADRRPTIDGIRAAASNLAPPFAPSPMYRSAQLSDIIGADVWLKVESTNPIASFKSRGASTAIGRALESRPANEIVTSSTGNHGQAVALASSVRGLPCHVFMPSEPNPVKRDMIALLGATLHLEGHDLDAAKELAIDFAAERGAFFVDDGQNVDVIEGAGTVGLEIAEALPSIDRVFIPMGSGTFASGCATALKAIHPEVVVTAVQSTQSPAMTESFRSGHPVERPAESIADGLECRVPAELAFQLVLALIDDVVAVPDADLLQAVRWLIEAHHLVAEPAGAAAVAGASTVRRELRGQTVVLVVSGGNLTPALLARSMAGPGQLPGAGS